jgi:hypothetical protein
MNVLTIRLSCVPARPDRRGQHQERHALDAGVHARPFDAEVEAEAVQRPGSWNELRQPAITTPIAIASTGGARPRDTPG